MPSCQSAHPRHLKPTSVRKATLSPALVHSDRLLTNVSILVTCKGGGAVLSESKTVMKRWRRREKGRPGKKVAGKAETTMRDKREGGPPRTLCSMTNTSEKYERTQQGNLTERERGPPRTLWDGCHVLSSPPWDGGRHNMYNHKKGDSTLASSGDPKFKKQI